MRQTPAWSGAHGRESILIGGMLAANFAEVAETLAGVALNPASRTQVRVDRDTLALLSRTSRPRCAGADPRTGPYTVHPDSREGCGLDVLLANLFRTSASCARSLCRDARDVLRRQLTLQGFDPSAWRLALEAEEG